MPRRSFLMRHRRMARLDPEVLGRYLRHWRAEDLYHRTGEFPRLQSGELFGNNKPLHLEIGCGTGEWICEMAVREPGANFVGVDINLKALHLAVSGAARLKLQNVIFVKAPVQYLLPLMPPCSLTAVYLHFPEPCLHAKYRKRRLFTEAFVEGIYNALLPGGMMRVVTDSKELLEEMLGRVEAEGRLKKLHEGRYLVGYEPEVKSRYQLYWEGHGVPIYRFEVGREE